LELTKEESYSGLALIENVYVA